MAITLKDDALNGERVQLFAELAGYSRFEAIGRLTCLWNYCVKNAVDVLDERKILGFLGVPASVLVDSDLAETVGNEIRVRGAREEIQARTRRTAHARAAGQASAQLRGPSQSPQLGANPGATPSQPAVNSESTRKSDLISDLRSGSDSLPLKLSSETSGDLKQQGAGQKAKAKRAPEILMPADFAANAAQVAYCLENQIDLAVEVAQFTDHHRARGGLFRDWSAALWTWLRNAVKFRRGGAASTPALRPGEFQRRWGDE